MNRKEKFFEFVNVVEGHHMTAVLLALLLMGATTAKAQEHLQRSAKTSEVKKAFTTVKELPITSVKNQYRSGTCWDYATLGYFESEILRQTGKTYDLCEMFVVNKDYMDCATHYVRMHGYSQISEGGSCDDVLEVIRQYGICPEDAMPAPGSLTGDSLANFKVFFPELERTVSGIVRKGAKEPMPHWQDSVQAVIEKYVGRCPESFVYEGKTYTPKSFAESLGLDMDNYLSLTSYTHHPFNEWFVLESPYKWRLKPSYNIPIEQLMDALDKALDAGYTVAWGGDVTGDFTRTGLAMLPDGVTPTQALRQEQWDDWRFTYDHVMLIYGKAHDEQGKPYYMVKNSWGKSGQYEGIWYMSRDYMALNTTYLFLNRQALPKDFVSATAQKADSGKPSETGVKKVYDEDINPLEQIDKALVKAKADGKYVICQVGGNWCPWCLRFADFITNDTTISKVISENFEYIHVNYNPRKSKDEKKAAQAAALMKRLNDCGRFGYPVFVVLNEEGDVLHIQDSSFLEEGQGYDPKKVLRFFKNWTPKAVPRQP